MFECTNCQAEQDPTRFDEDLVKAANAAADSDDTIACVEQIVQLPEWAYNEAIDDFDGNRSSFCASCRWDLQETAVEIMEADA